MKVTVARDGAVLGTWERADIQAAVADGTLKPDDHYFAKGMATWLELSTLISALPLPDTAHLGDPTTARSHWKLIVTHAGWVLIGLAGASAFFNPSYFLQALIGAAGAMLILAARNLR
jgi:hypothetical protein